MNFALASLWNIMRPNLDELRKSAIPIQTGRTPNATESDKESIWIP